VGDLQFSRARRTHEPLFLSSPGPEEALSYNSFLLSLQDHFVGQALMAHTYNPSDSGGRDQGDHSSKSWANNSGDPISKKTHHEKGLVEWLKV
jgi:hypothetical protein